MTRLEAMAVALSLCATGARGLVSMGAKTDGDGDPEMRKLGAVDAGSDMWPFGRRDAAKGTTAKNVTVILNGEPKSGTTWLEYVIKDLLTEVCAKESGCQLLQGKDGRTVAAQRTSALVQYDMSTKHMIPNVGHANSFDFSNAPSMTDAQVEAAAKATLDGAAESAKWLVIFRDPRDVTISSCYHMVKNCPNPSGYVGGKIGRISQWINLRYRLFDALRKLAPDRVLMLYYEEMKKDEQGTIGRLADYFGVPLNKKQGMLISSRTTFSAMKDSGSKIAQGGAASGKVREGASCGYAKELDADSAKRITDMMRRDLSPALNAVWAC
jgi:hypothetical protein